MPLLACQPKGGVVELCTAYPDQDGDGFGDGSDPWQGPCWNIPADHLSDGSDCDDGDAAVHPDALDTCNGVDDDCDGQIDEEDPQTWYRDADGDGYGDSGDTTEACAAPSGYAAEGGDCDDGDPDTYPGAEEPCDGLDHDCDGQVGLSGLDSDGDGLDNCVDPTVYAYDFDDEAWTGWDWVDLGGGNAPLWTMEGGTLSETSNSGWSIAYGPDLGELPSYTISVSTMIAGGATDVSAIVFAYEDTSSYLLARWLDPTDHYGYYDNGGRLDIYLCDFGACGTLATDDGSQDLTADFDEWVSLSVTVSDEHISLHWRGQELVACDLSSGPLGPARVGLYTDDNDGGVYYDDLEVTVP